MAGNEARVGTALVNYAAKDAGFSKTTKRVNNGLTRFEKKAGSARQAANRLGSAFAGMAKGYLGFGALLATVAGSSGISRFVEQQAEMATQMLAFSRITGLTTTEIQILRKAFGAFTINTEAADKGIKKLTQSVFEARRGSATYVQAFQKLGITTQELQSLEMWELLQRFGDAMRQNIDPTDKAGAAMALFGARGVALADALGKMELRNKEFVQSLVDTGIVTTTEIKKLDDFTQSLDTIGDQLDPIKAKEAANLTESIIDMKKAILDFQKSLHESGTIGFFSELFSTLGDGFSIIRDTGVSIFGDLDEPSRLRSALGMGSDRYIYEQKLIPGIERAVKKAEDNLAKLHQNVADFTFTPSARQQTYIDRQIKAAETVLEEARKKQKKIFDDYNRLVPGGKLKPGDTQPTISVAPPAPPPPTGETEEERIRAQLRREQDALSMDARHIRARESIAERAAEKAKLRALSEMPLNAFGGEGEKYDVALQNEFNKITAQIYRESQLAKNAVISLSDETKQRLTPVVEGLSTQFNSFFTNIINGTESASEAFKNLALKITEAVFQALVLKPLVDSITGGVGNFFGIDVGQSIGKRAVGGPVAAGNPYIVGERGPELFVPATAGKIMPNNRMGGGVTITQHNEFKLFDDTGFEQRMIPIAAAIKEESMRGTMEALQAPGAMAN